MKTLLFKFRRLTLGLVVVLVLALSFSSAQTAPLSAPTAPVSADALASLDQDVQALQRQVGQLGLQVKSLQDDNDALKQKILTQEQVKTMIENMLAASRAQIDQDIAQAVSDSHKDILAEVAKQMEALAKDTNTQLEKLARAIGNAPAPTPVTVNPANMPKFDKGQVYKVQKGDSLAKIARKFNVSQNDILLANHLTNANLIREGQDLFIPQNDGVSTPAAASTSAPSTSSGN